MKAELKSLNTAAKVISLPNPNSEKHLHHSPGGVRYRGTLVEEPSVLPIPALFSQLTKSLSTYSFFLHRSKAPQSSAGLPTGIKDRQHPSRLLHLPALSNEMWISGGGRPSRPVLPGYSPTVHLLLLQSSELALPSLEINSLLGILHTGWSLNSHCGFQVLNGS